MKATTIKTISAFVGTAALAGTTVAGLAAAPAATSVQQGGTAPAATQQAALGAHASQEGFVHVAHATGAFSYDQNAVTPTHAITDVFCKAASALCVSLPDYQAKASNGTIRIGGTAGGETYATVDEIADSEGSKKITLTCSCASNGAGGGAIANAQVEGVDLKTIASIANTR